MHPQQSSWDPPLYKLGFARSVVEHWTFESPKVDIVNADLSLSCRNFLYHDFDTRDVEQLVFPTPEPRYVETPTHTRVLTFNGPSLHRHFGVCNIANPNAYVSGLLAAKPRNGMPLFHSSTPLWPHTNLLGCQDVVVRDFTIPVALFTGLQPTKPRCTIPRVNPMVLVTPIYGPSPPKL
jgi:hypothetical protein